jgi:O-antigen/teichoic acid export membrane protein
MAGQGAGLLFQAINFVFLARLIGSTEYGVFVGAFAFSSLFAQYSGLGTGSVFLRYVTGRPDEFAPYFGNVLLFTSAMSGFLIATLTLSSRHFLNPASAHIVLLTAIGNCFFGQLTQEIGKIFQSFEKMRITATLNLLVTALRALAVVVLIVTIHRASAFQWVIVSTAVSGFAAATAVILVIVNFGWPIFNPRLALKHAWEGFGFSFGASTSSVYNDIDKTMLSHYGMNESNGIYSMAYRVIDLSSMPIFAIRDAVTPRLFERGRNGIVHSAEYGGRILRRAIILSLGISVALMLCAPIIPRLAGHGFSQSVIALRWLAIIPIFRCIHQLKGIVLTTSGHQSFRVGAQLAAACFNFGVNLWLIPHYGWRGAAWASIVTDGALAAVMWLAVKVFSRLAAQRFAFPASS